jgi:uncharacterized protein YjbJ (UPF0337 family)
VFHARPWRGVVGGLRDGRALSYTSIDATTTGAARAGWHSRSQAERHRAQNPNNTTRSIGATYIAKEHAMNKDQVNGRMETAKGNVKEAAGKVVGNDRLAAEGRADQVAGKVQSTAGDLKNKAGDAIKNAIDR